MYAPNIEYLQLWYYVILRITYYSMNEYVIIADVNIDCTVILIRI